MIMAREREIEAAIMALPQNTGCQLVWDTYGGITHRVRLVCNGVSAYSGIGLIREEALGDLMVALQIEATFDNPDNPNARWGKAYLARGNGIFLSFVGWGYLWEIKGVRNECR